jgi:hypothetical protein
MLNLSLLGGSDPRYKRAPIPPFYGEESENVSDFIFLLETQFVIDRLPDEEKVYEAVGYLREAPLANSPFPKRPKYANRAGGAQG